jgi:type I restriction enzyme S subunit
MTLAEWPRYDSYRNDAAAWLGEVPTEWRFEKAKWFLMYRKQINADGMIDNVLSLTLRGVVNNDPNNPEGLVPKDYCTYQIFDADDLVFKLIDLENVRTSRVGLVHEQGIMSSAYIRVVPPEGWNARFLYYFYYHLYEAAVFNKIGSGVRSTLGQSDLLELPIPVIDGGVQDRIVRLLDEKCAKVDEAVRIKEEQIALLRERRQILIQQAVTRGLNPSAPMKDSGIDWVGHIPEHWETKRAKFIFREINERSLDGTEELLSVSHTTGVTSRAEKNISIFMAEDYTGAKICRPGDVVFNTMWAWMGALGVSNVTGLVSPSYGVYRQLEQGSFNNKYLEWLLRSSRYVEHYNRISTGLHSSRLRLYAHMFLGMFLGFPSRVEQDEIVAFVEAAAGKIDAGMAIKEEQIAALKEYKTSLINAAVTGKIKVDH